jgi:hypothetical protein
MIKQTYKSKNGIKTTEKQASPSVQPKPKRWSRPLSASQVSLAAGASALSCDSGPPPHQVIKLGIDVHLDRYVVVRPSRRNDSAPPSFWPLQECSGGFSLSGIEV